MVAEITQAQNNAVLTGKTEKYGKVSLRFQAELNKKMEYIKTIEQLRLQNTTTVSSSNVTQKTATESKEPTKSRVEETIDMLKQMIQNAAIKAKSNLSPEKIDKMSLNELKATAKSIMSDAKDFINLANSIELLKKVPEDCCCMFDFDSDGKCTVFKIFRPDGTIVDGDIDSVPSIFTNDDLDKIIQRMSLDSLKAFCLDGSDPLKLFEDIFDNLKNTDFGNNKELAEKIKKLPEQIDQIKENMKEKEALPQVG